MDKSSLIEVVIVLAVIGSLVLAWLRYRRPAAPALQRDRVAPSLHEGFDSAAERVEARRSPSL